MKKYSLYILISVLVIAIAVLLFTTKKEKEFDKRVTLNKNHEIPYGTAVCYNMMPLMFNNSSIKVIKNSPSKWFYGNETEIKNTLLFVISPQFNPTNEEMVLLDRFVKNGNQVFISSLQMNTIARDYFEVNANAYVNYFGNFSDTAVVNLLKPAYLKDTTYTYPGYTSNNTLTRFNNTKFITLGTNQNGYANFIKASLGDGNFYLHSNPFLFTNYFILYKKNVDYFKKSISIVPENVKQIYWDEHFIYQSDNENDKAKEQGALRVLLKNKSFKWAFWIAIFFLLVYLLFHAKRKQTAIPKIQQPVNESMDFVKTIGKLYFEKNDNTNLAQKMVVYFLEHVRSKYFINTSTLNNEFVQKLVGKSGYDEEKIKNIIASIEKINAGYLVQQTQLKFYYEQFQHFYKNTA